MFKILLLLAALTITEIAAVPQFEFFAKDACAQSGIFGRFADGTQPQSAAEGPRCSRTIHGAIPTIDKMVSTMIITPASGATIAAKKQDVIFTIRSTNMEFAHFDDPKTQYQFNGQILNAKGVIRGHSHLVIQRITNPTSPPSPQERDLTFFKGLDFQPLAGSPDTLRLTVERGNFTAAGTYRACTMTASSAHAPVIMPVARRGPQDDCIRFNVV
ncbi:hypothetical protein BKA69DRAFT_1036741 [Paraphysoderma sedebokerense]|nr:hypothetical protein BKA69DRAFT_1036741 [Paraphysoderma sedebokerense]